MIFCVAQALSCSFILHHMLLCSDTESQCITINHAQLHHVFWSHYFVLHPYKLHAIMRCHRMSCSRNIFSQFSTMFFTLCPTPLTFLNSCHILSIPSLHRSITPSLRNIQSSHAVTTCGPAMLLI